MAIEEYGRTDQKLSHIILTQIVPNKQTEKDTELFDNGRSQSHLSVVSRADPRNNVNKGGRKGKGLILLQETVCVPKVEVLL